MTDQAWQDAELNSALEENPQILRHNIARPPGASWPTLASLQGWARTRPVEPLQEVLSTV